MYAGEITTDGSRTLHSTYNAAHSEDVVLIILSKKKCLSIAGQATHLHTVQQTINATCKHTGCFIRLLLTTFGTVKSKP
jgi:hypothetical protein